MDLSPLAPFLARSLASYAALTLKGTPSDKDTAPHNAGSARCADRIPRSIFSFLSLKEIILFLLEITKIKPLEKMVMTLFLVVTTVILSSAVLVVIP